MQNRPVVIDKVVSMPFDENTYILYRPGRNDCLVVDPGFDPQQILDSLEQHALTPAAILLTHGHADHIAGNDFLKQRWPACPIFIGHGDASKLVDPVGNLSAAYGINLLSPPADRLVRHEEELEIAGITLSVRETPGHSSGHVVYLIEHEVPLLVIGGDVLFAGSIGRTDFHDGNLADLKKSIHEQLFVLPDATVVLPGHGPETTIGQEKRTNPFVGVNARYDA